MSAGLFVAGLWGYPVKTLAGEAIEWADLTPEGVPGDRIVHVRGPEGVRTSRRHHHLLGLHGTLWPDGQPSIDAHHWASAEALALVAAAAAEHPGRKGDRAESNEITRGFRVR
jgi:uncharacterized protein YcbX